MRGIMMGVKHVHDYSFVHRDIKPSNIVFNEMDDMDSGRLIDFGLAVRISTSQNIKNETCGTLIYQSPE
jgi:serine/threonine-protein kinase